MQYLVVAFLAVTGVQLASGKIFTRCELAEELLKKQKFERNYIEDWVCLIEAHSGRDTSKKMMEIGGSIQWGLYQINDQFWCKRGVAGGSCNVACEDLLTDDITQSSICAQKIFRLHGFQGWYGWKNYCYNSNKLPDLSECNL